MLLLWLACKMPTPTDSVPIEDVLTEPGPWGVGFRVSSIEYEAAGVRTLRTAIWYPTDAPPTGSFKYLGIFDAPGVLEDAAPAEGAFPLLTYSHGHQGFAEASGRIVSHLASHGYVVVAPDHTGNTFLDGPERDTEIFWQRATDIGAVLDDTLAPSHFLADVISDDPIVAMGHSFGGYTVNSLAGARFDIDATQAACDGGDTQDICSTLDASDIDIFRHGLRDERITAIITMAPGNIDLFGPTGLEAIDLPVMLMSGGLDNPPLAAAHWQAFAKPGNLHVEIRDAGHNAFSDFAASLDVDPGTIEAETAWTVIGAYALAFVRRQHGDTAVDPVLNGDRTIGTTTTLSLP